MISVELGLDKTYDESVTWEALPRNVSSLHIDPWLSNISPNNSHHLYNLSLVLLLPPSPPIYPSRLYRNSQITPQTQPLGAMQAQAQLTNQGEAGIAPSRISAPQRAAHARITITGIIPASRIHSLH